MRLCSSSNGAPRRDGRRPDGLLADGGGFIESCDPGGGGGGGPR